MKKNNNYLRLKNLMIKFKTKWLSKSKLNRIGTKPSVLYVEEFLIINILIKEEIYY
jgi:hypothetical protein